MSKLTYRSHCAGDHGLNCVILDHSIQHAIDRHALRFWHEHGREVVFSDVRARRR